MLNALMLSKIPCKWKCTNTPCSQSLEKFAKKKIFGVKLVTHNIAGPQFQRVVVGRFLSDFQSDVVSW